MGQTPWAKDWVKSLDNNSKDDYRACNLRLRSKWIYKDSEPPGVLPESIDLIKHVDPARGKSNSPAPIFNYTLEGKREKEPSPQ